MTLGQFRAVEIQASAIRSGNDTSPRCDMLIWLSREAVSRTAQGNSEGVKDGGCDNSFLAAIA